MNFKTELFLALRFLKPGRNAVSVISVISLLGVTLGVAVLIVVLSVFTGFTDLMREKLLDTRAHLQIYSSRSGVIADPAFVVRAVEQAGGQATPVISMPILLLNRNDFVPKRIMAADPAKIRTLFKVAADHDLAPGEVWVSEEIARQNNLERGDTVHLHTPEHLAKIAKEFLSDDKKNTAKVQIQTVGYKVGGIYSMGKYDFDKEIIFMTLPDAAAIAGIPNGMSVSVYAWLADPFQLDAPIKAITENLRLSTQPFEIYTWMRLNGQMFAMLESQKNMMIFIFFFIILIAAFSIGNTLITIVVQKGREIGLLKALGASPWTMMRVFIWEGLCVGILGSLSGLGLGMLALCYRNDFLHFLEKITGRDLFPKEMYYFNELPAHTGVLDVTLIVTMAVVLCTLGGFLPAWRAARLDPANALRDE